MQFSLPYYKNYIINQNINDMFIFYIDWYNYEKCKETIK